MPTRTAWFTDPDIDSTTQTSDLPTPTTSATSATSAILPILQEHEPSASAKQDFNLQLQNTLSTPTSLLADAFAIIASIVLEEPYKPKS